MLGFRAGVNNNYNIFAKFRLQAVIPRLNGKNPVDALQRIYIPQRLRHAHPTYPGGGRPLRDGIRSENALLRAYVLMNVRGRDPMSFVEEASKIVT
ncbi:MAG: czcA 1 [Candidatus Brocadiaceae bacterium]|nr:czcA 1 [Candidatus Brocadiaceae bacterium]